MPRILEVVHSDQTYGIGLDESRGAAELGSAAVIFLKVRQGGPFARVGVVFGDRVELDPHDVQLGYVDLNAADMVRAGNPPRQRS